MFWVFFCPAYVGIINLTMCHKRALCLTSGVSERSHQTWTWEREIAQWVLRDFTAWPFSVLSEPFVWPTAWAVITQHDGLLVAVSNPAWWAKRLSRKLSAPGIWRHSFYQTYRIPLSLSFSPNSVWDGLNLSNWGPCVLYCSDRC